MAKRKVCESNSFSKSWLEQAGGTFVDATQVSGSKKRTRKSSKRQKSKHKFATSQHSSKCKEASEQQTRSFATRVPGMVESSLGGAHCGTEKFITPTTIIIFKLITKPNMVEFVFLGPKLAEMALIWLAGRRMVRQMVKKDNVGFTLTIASENTSAWAKSSTLSKSTWEFWFDV